MKKSTFVSRFYFVGLCPKCSDKLNFHHKYVIVFTKYLLKILTDRCIVFTGEKKFYQLKRRFRKYLWWNQVSRFSNQTLIFKTSLITLDQHQLPFGYLKSIVFFKEKHKKKTKRKKDKEESSSSSSSSESEDSDDDEWVEKDSNTASSTASTSKATDEKAPADIWKGPLKITEEKTREEEFDDYFEGMFL